MSSSLTGLFGNALGDILSESLGLEPTDAELDARSDAAFARFDADASGALDFAEILAAFATMPIRALDPAVVRDVFDRFDADDSGTLDRAEFRAMMRALRSAANVDRMPGLISSARASSPTRARTQSSPSACGSSGSTERPTAPGAPWPRPSRRRRR